MSKQPMNAKGPTYSGNGGATSVMNRPAANGNSEGAQIKPLRRALAKASRLSVAASLS